MTGSPACAPCATAGWCIGASWRTSYCRAATAGWSWRTTWRAASQINGNIIDSTGTLAARMLASGMLNGITSPTRPWFKLQIEGYEEDHDVQGWLEDCERRMMMVFQESNFYQSMARSISIWSCSGRPASSYTKTTITSFTASTPAWRVLLRSEQQPRGRHSCARVRTNPLPDGRRVRRGES